ncbi:DUF89 domain-containing protein [uncultured Methanofollis sp.]|uniref:damage-control phosphatase ARMT1 family protein n=1 Tax=uncultured Methanofollis sp. TaxID=262500 RepID=UPI00262FDDB9|nr:ARMT1-like domain-containing protein [uncultured Methanofollis sp.]
MKFQPRCTECLLSRVGYEAGLVLDDPGAVERVRRAATAMLAARKDDPEVPASVLASAVHRCAYDLIGVDDPYRDLKKQNSRDALHAAEKVAPALHTFRDYVTAAVIGNTFDYGVQSHQVTSDFLSFFGEEFPKGLAVDDTDRILPLCRDVVYFTDNCGEIVFDRLLLRYLKTRGAKVTVVVRGAPILNDATMEDALALGLDTVVDRVTATTCGERELGVNLSLIPDDVADALGRCSLVIAKGMANYEALTEYDDLPPTAFLMAVKCETIAQIVGVPKGSKVAVLRD